jgi:polyribonucleotide nucleotidyltransferase
LDSQRLRAIEIIKSLTAPQVGETYGPKVVRVEPYGAFLEFARARMTCVSRSTGARGVGRAVHADRRGRWQIIEVDRD